MVVWELGTAVAGLGTDETGGSGGGGGLKRFGALVFEKKTATVGMRTVGKGGAQAWDR